MHHVALDLRVVLALRLLRSGRARTLHACFGGWRQVAGVSQRRWVEQRARDNQRRAAVRLAVLHGRRSLHVCFSAWRDVRFVVSPEAVKLANEQTEKLKAGG